jgi:CPA2 family monovalent cation:H+ antiporter-2
MLGLLPAEGRDKILEGALLSITLNPFVFATITPVTRWVRARPAVYSRLERGATRLGTLPENPHSNPLRDHAVIVGFGRVGSKIGAALAQEGVPYVVIERDLPLVDTLRQRGIRAIYGDASAPGVMERAGIQNAKLLVVASPDHYAARRVLELARKKNPHVDTVVRTHSDQELEHFEKQGVGRVMMGERELALAMADYARDAMMKKGGS